MIVGDFHQVRQISFDNRRMVQVKAGRHHTERVVPPAGEEFAFDREVWDHEIEVYVSATGRSVRVFIDGAEIKVPKVTT